eukprot:9482034-Pyramimonas_sp.AAC.1
MRQRDRRRGYERPRKLSTTICTRRTRQAVGSRGRASGRPRHQRAQGGPPEVWTMSPGPLVRAVL